MNQLPSTATTPQVQELYKQVLQLNPGSQTDYGHRQAVLSQLELKIQYDG